MAQIVERSNRIIRRLAEEEKFDIIFQEALYASPSIDITDTSVNTRHSGMPGII